MDEKWTGQTGPSDSSIIRMSFPRRSSRLLWRIFAPFACGGLVLLAVGGLAASYIVRVQNFSSEMLAWNVSSIRAAEELEIVIRETRYRLNQFLLTGDPSHLEAAAALRESTEQWIAEAGRLATMPDEQQLVEQVRTGYQHFLNERERLVEGNVDTEIVRYLARDILPNEVLGPARDYLDLNEQHLARSSAENESVADRLVIGLLLLTLCGAVGGLMAGYGLARGISRSILELSVPVRDVAGQLANVVGPITVSADPQLEDLEQILQVVSERVATVIAQLEASQTVAMRSEQLASLGQFAAGLAHELRNPLMAMKILVQSALERDPAASLSGRDLTVIDEEITRLEQLVQGFLDFARPPETIRQSVSLAEIITPTVNLVTAQANRSGVSVSCQIDAELPPVDADAGQLRQVVLNLLLNAIDATPAGGEVAVHARRQNGNAVVQVADTGRGLPEFLGDTIFDPFVSTRETGIGLGLSICRRIVETHQGAITAKTRAEGGAEVTVTIPVSQNPQSILVAGHD